MKTRKNDPQQSGRRDTPARSFCQRAARPFVGPQWGPPKSPAWGTWKIRPRWLFWVDVGFGVARPAFHWAGSFAACTRPQICTARHAVFNRNITRLELALTLANSTRAPFLTATKSYIAGPPSFVFFACNHWPLSAVVTSEENMTTTNDNSFAVRAANVSRHYQMGAALIRAVDDISLEIRSGEFLALLGSSGSGKSTLLNMMAGLDRPTSGDIFAQGRNLREMTPLELARYRREAVGMVFQSFNLLPRMTLEENVELPLRLAEVDRSERAGRVREALERVRLEKRLAHRPSELSGGEQQRAALARALVNRPKLLFADEPTGNLDSATGEEIMRLLAEIQHSLGMTIVMVTHERPLADRFADRIAALADGKLVSDGINESVQRSEVQR